MVDALGPAGPRLSAPGRDGMGPLSPSRRPHCGCCRRQEDCDGLCVAATAAAPVLGDGPELVTVRVREAEQRPLLRSLFRRGPRRYLWWQPDPSLLSAVVSGLCPGTFWLQHLGAAMVLGVSCFLFPLWRPLSGPWLKSHPGCTVPAFCLFPECLCCFLFLLPYPGLSVWVLPYTTSSSTTLSCLNPALRIRVVSVVIKASEQSRDL